MRSSIFVPVLITALVLGTAAAAAPPLLVDASARIVRTCATPEPGKAVMDRTQAAVRAFAARPPTPSSGGGQIRVAFHVVTSGSEGNVPQSQIDAQIKELNRDFRGTGYTFALASVDRTDDRRWFKLLPGTGDEKNMKQALAIDPAHRFNVYTCAPGQDLLGWAYYPQSLPEDSFLHGVVIHYGSLPGGFITRYNLGRTLVHEAGHYLGLFHTFQNGCNAPGDLVDDTPFEATPAYGCQVGRNTCPQPGDDPVHNYMDYSDDDCLTEFTNGQEARMDAIVSTYRPSLLGDGQIAQLTEGLLGGLNAFHSRQTVDFRGGFPNPFRDETLLHFYLPRSEHVALQVYNIAGQRVATLVDAELSAGAHQVPLRAKDLSPGMYFTALRTAGGSHLRSVLLVP